MFYQNMFIRYRATPSMANFYEHYIDMGNHFWFLLYVIFSWTCYLRFFLALKKIAVAPFVTFICFILWIEPFPMMQSSGGIFSQYRFGSAKPVTLILTCPCLPLFISFAQDRCYPHGPVGGVFKHAVWDSRRGVINVVLTYLTTVFALFEVSW